MTCFWVSCNIFVWVFVTKSHTPCGTKSALSRHQVTLSGIIVSQNCEIFATYSHVLKNFFRWYHWGSANFKKYIWWYDK